MLALACGSLGSAAVAYAQPSDLPICSANHGLARLDASTLDQVAVDVPLNTPMEPTHDSAPARMGC